MKFLIMYISPFTLSTIVQIFSPEPCSQTPSAYILPLL
jgi:hypothetical protein